jgi:RNA polymerase sigma factor (sigma-70 family)
MTYARIRADMQDLEESTSAVVEKFSGLIRQVIQRNLHRSDGIDFQDIEQEVRVRIWAFLKKGKKVDHLPSYIKKVAYTKTIDELRKVMKQRPSGEPESLRQVFSGACQVAVPPRDFSPEGRLDDLEAGDAVRAMVDGLSRNRKKVLDLFLTGLTIEEISASLRWDRSKVRHLFYRGVDDLREMSRGRRDALDARLAENPPPERRP